MLKAKRETKPKIGDLWLWAKLPPMLFAYTEDGWMVLYATVEEIASTLSLAQLAGIEPIRANHPPPNARRYV